ncbi:MAG: hypothetical protein K2N63_06140 [Lachnospiraceae bacterium]|nr:hypothetical protein [Lachnospiraceae bacterium]
MKEGIVLVLLVGFGIVDIRKKSLSVPVLVLVLGAAVLFRLLWDGGIVAGGAGLLSGFLICAVGKISRGQIGMGDGFLLAVTGMLLGFWKNMELFLTGLFFCAVFSAGILIFFRKGRGYQVPFVPFLAVAQLFRILVLL